jgi:serine-type D-Ala-D-Ala carboxypeptidase/endopeptidase
MQRRRLLNQGAMAMFAAATAVGLDADAQAADPPIEPLLRERLQHEGVGLAAMRVRGSAVPEQAWAGRLGATGDLSIDSGTRFEWGSITKVLVGLLLADCVARGECRLADAVETVLPDGLRLRDSSGEPLRWIDLATHRSGLPRLPANLKPNDVADPYADYDAAAMWAGLRDWRPTRLRGASWEYSNLGFSLPGEALGRLVGRAFEAALRERVLVPLGLPGLGLRRTGRPEARAAQGHDAERRPVPAWQFQAMAGAGAVLGTIDELARLAQAVAGAVPHGLERAVQIATQRQADGPNARVGMGLAWLIAPGPGGRELINHDGGTFGFSSSLFVDRSARSAAGVLANTFVVVNDLALHLLDAAAPLRNPAAEAAARRQAQQQAAVSLPAAQVAALIGRYALNADFKLDIRVREARIFGQATGQGEFELFASGPRRVFARVARIEIEFDGDEGAAPSLLLLQGGQRLRFVRE